MKDVTDCGGREEDAQQFQLVGDSNAAPTEVGFRNLPHQRGDPYWGLVGGSSGGLLIFDLVQPAVERGSGDAEISPDLSPGDLEGLHMPEDQESFADFISRLLALLVDLFLEDRQLHLELVDLIFEK